jgi:hypothetical protein
MLIITHLILLEIMTISKQKQWSELINKLIEKIKHYIEYNS